MTAKRPAVIVGDADDPHVGAVLDRLLAAHAPTPHVVDLEEIQRRGVTLAEAGIFVGPTSSSSVIDLGEPRRGWLRRLHSPTWAFGLEAGDVASVEAAAWHTAFSGSLTESNVQWVTDPKDLRASESKINQWRTARALAIPFPKTLITSDPDEVTNRFDADIVVKPLGAAQYLIAGVTHTIFARRMKASDPLLSALRSAPFIVQECLVPRRHLRVVTVGSEAWVCALTATAEMAVDWRREEANHHSFRHLRSGMDHVIKGALQMASALRLGYSSQDWIETDDGFFLIDVNPSGQWLFLNEDVAAAVADAIALNLGAPLEEAAV